MNEVMLKTITLTLTQKYLKPFSVLKRDIIYIVTKSKHVKSPHDYHIRNTIIMAAICNCVLSLLSTNFIVSTFNGEQCILDGDNCPTVSRLFP